MSHYQMTRGWMEEPFFADGQPYTFREAWVSMTESARYEDGDARVGSEVVYLKRGQFAAALTFLAEKFHWDKGRSKVYRFLKRLTRAKMIEMNGDHEWLVITICKYDEDQLKPRFYKLDSETQNEIRAKQRRNGAESNKNTNIISSNTPNTSDKSKDVQKSNFAGSGNVSKPLEPIDPKLISILKTSNMFPDSIIHTHFHGCVLSEDQKTIVAQTEWQAETIKAKHETQLRLAFGFYPEITAREKSRNRPVER